VLTSFKMGAMFVPAPKLSRTQLQRSALQVLAACLRLRGASHLPIASFMQRLSLSDAKVAKWYRPTHLSSGSR
jgi:hypothetical protein